jgi:hypothetical protein
LVAANRLKSFLIAEGINVPSEIIKGLAHLSEPLVSEMNAFVDGERERLRRKSLLGRLFPRTRAG